MIGISMQKSIALSSLEWGQVAYADPLPYYRKFLQSLLRSKEESMHAEIIQIELTNSRSFILRLTCTGGIECKCLTRPSRRSGAVWKTCLSWGGGSCNRTGKECGRVFWQHLIKPSQIRACFHTYIVNKDHTLDRSFSLPHTCFVINRCKIFITKPTILG